MSDIQCSHAYTNGASSQQDWPSRKRGNSRFLEYYVTKQSTRKEVGRQSRGSVTGTQKLNKDEFHAISESVSGTALNQDMLSNRNMLSIGLDFDGLRPEGKASPAPPSTRPYRTLRHQLRARPKESRKRAKALQSRAQRELGGAVVAAV